MNRECLDCQTETNEYAPASARSTKQCKHVEELAVTFGHENPDISEYTRGYIWSTKQYKMTEFSRERGVTNTCCVLSRVTW